MMAPTTIATGARTTPIQKMVQLCSMRPMPPTTKAARPTTTAVQAAGVLPWLSDMELLGREIGVGCRRDDSRHPRRSPAPSSRRIGRVAPLVELVPQVALRAGLLDRRGGAGRVVPATHLRPLPHPAHGDR